MSQAPETMLVEKNLSCGEFFHMTDCHVEKVHHMTNCQWRQIYSEIVRLEIKGQILGMIKGGTQI